MIKIKTTNGDIVMNTNMSEIRKFMESGEQFIDTGDGFLNKSFIVSIQPIVEKYWNGTLLDEKGNYFMRDGEKIFLSPYEKKQIEEREVIKKINGKDNKRLQMGDDQ